MIRVTGYQMTELFVQMFSLHYTFRNLHIGYSRMGKYLPPLSLDDYFKEESRANLILQNNSDI